MFALKVSKQQLSTLNFDVERRRMSWSQKSFIISNYLSKSTVCNKIKSSKSIHLNIISSTICATAKEDEMRERVLSWIEVCNLKSLTFQEFTARSCLTKQNNNVTYSSSFNVQSFKFTQVHTYTIFIYKLVHPQNKNHCFTLYSFIPCT